MVHSEIATAHSGYFRRQFAREMKMQNSPIHINHLTNYDANAVRRMINFFYTGILPCSLAEVPELLALCCELQVIVKLFLKCKNQKKKQIKITKYHSQFKD